MVRKIKDNFRIGFAYKNRTLRKISLVLDLIAIIIMGYFIDISKPIGFITIILICIILKFSGYIDMINEKDKSKDEKGDN